MATSDAVRRHYERRGRNDPCKATRTTSPSYGVRQGSNFVKTTLINYACHIAPTNRKGTVRVLDVGCGKGGDLQKWWRNSAKRIVEYEGFDVSETRVDSAQARYERMRGPPRMIAHADFFTADMVDVPYDGANTSIVSVMFALHYGVPDAESATRLIQGFASTIRAGGCVIGTIVSIERLCERLRSGRGGWTNALCTTRCEEWPMTDDDMREYATRRYGLRYTFSLEGALDACPEYNIPSIFFETLQCETGCDMLRMPFSQWLDSQEMQRTTPVHVCTKMCPDAPYDTASREVLALYDVFVLSARSVGTY